MGDKNHIRTLEDYSKPSQEGYMNTIELHVGNNVGKMRLCLFQFSFLDQASNWLECLPAGSITTWEDLTTRFLAQLFPSGRTAKLHNDILMFQQHHRESLSEASTLHPIARLIELENQVQRLMEAHLALTQPTQVNKITTSCEICSGPHDTQYCMEDPKQAFVEYAFLAVTDVAREGLVSNFMASQDARLTKFEADFKQQQSDMTNKIDTVLKAITDRIAGALPSDTVKNSKLSTFLVLSTRSYSTIDPRCSSHPSTSINAIKAHSKEANISQTSLLQPGMEIKTQQLEEPAPTLKDEF
ncbi:MAK10-like protein [Tanacetum coccineum]|uniref:MAK10-like protein n=1 Tax=Tanacetum coccineum TaxID=301880 RepID=A0ABQ5EWZ6_9ASTR